MSDQEAQSPTVDREEDEEVQDDDGESEGAGADLRPGHGSLSDSFEEEEEDSEADRENDAFLDAIEAVLRFVDIDFLEPLFIWHHRSERPVAHLDALDQVPLVYCPSTFRDLQVEDAYFDELMDQLTTVEEIADAQAWLSMKYGSKLAEVEKAKELEEEDGADGEASAPKQPKYKRATRETRYETAKQSIVAKLAEAIGISSADLALDVAGGTKSHFAEDPNEPPRAL
ncbi:hypothetical protein JCM21900_003121, partial [Sporobolomyces salmonicolor]